MNALVAERRLRALSGIQQVWLALHAYMYAHLPIIMGAIFFSLGVKKTLAHTDEARSMVPAVALCGGLILYRIGQVWDYEPGEVGRWPGQGLLLFWR